MTSSLTLTLRFFGNLVGAFAAREQSTETKACLLRLQAAIYKLPDQNRSLGVIEGDFDGEGGGACCGVCIDKD